MWNDGFGGLAPGSEVGMGSVAGPGGVRAGPTWAQDHGRDNNKWPTQNAPDVTDGRHS